MADEVESKRGETWLQRLGFDKEKEATVDTLLSDLDEVSEQKLMEDDSIQMIQAVIKNSELTVRDIMIPRAKVIMIEVDAPFKESLEKIIQSGHSRFPVLSDNHEEIIGVLLSKDLLPYVGEKDVNVESLIRPIEYVPEGKNIIALINEFRTKRSHLALVVDEFGSVSGLITIEDLLEQIVGKIDDEHDIERDEEPLIKRLSDDTFVVNALITLEAFSDAFGVELDVEDVETISGLLMKQSGTLPQEGDEIDLGHIRFKILPYQGNFIEYVEVLIE